MRSVISWITVAIPLGLVSCALPTGTQRSTGSGNLDQQFWRSIKKADVIYVGETHDDPADHQFQLEIIGGLLTRKTKFAIGWEMFDQTQQGALNARAAQATSLEELLAETDFQRHWGIYSPVYRQILQMSGSAKIPNLALNAAPELPRKVARGEPLTDKEKGMMPSGFVSSEQGYQNFVAMMGGHPGTPENALRPFFAAQNVWDQTMASQILRFKARNPKLLLVVLTGRGHVSGGFGIPFYVHQKAAGLKQIVLLREEINPWAVRR
jgi:uncharacterized iron-regulated protein